jgi:hypothetical protein
VPGVADRDLWLAGRGGNAGVDGLADGDGDTPVAARALDDGDEEGVRVWRAV